jgi:hypothetical protein
LKRIYTLSNCSSVDYAPLISIHAFSQDKIVVTSGGGMWWFNGNRWYPECSINPILAGEINKIWGFNSDDLFAIGNNGMIAHWDGKRWTKIESGTDVYLYDIWGEKNKNNEIIFVGTSPITLNTFIGKIKDLRVEKVGSKNLYSIITGVWFLSKRKYYVVGSGIFTTNNPDKGWERIYVTNYFSSDVTGTGLNDVYIVGNYNDFLHFNGYSWYQKVFPSNNASRGFYRVEEKNGIVAFVGYDGPKAIIVIAKRLG